jgi:hypothetical protein
MQSGSLTAVVVHTGETKSEAGLTGLFEEFVIRLFGSVIERPPLQGVQFRRRLTATRPRRERRFNLPAPF